MVPTDDGDGEHAPVEGHNEPAPAAGQIGGDDLGPSTVTLSGLLNAIDGVSSQEGCILLGTT